MKTADFVQQNYFVCTRASFTRQTHDNVSTKIQHFIIRFDTKAQCALTEKNVPVHRSSTKGKKKSSSKMTRKYGTTSTIRIQVILLESNFLFHFACTIALQGKQTHSQSDKLAIVLSLFASAFCEASSCKHLFKTLSVLHTACLTPEPAPQTNSTNIT